jgi:hypothetical protein
VIGICSPEHETDLEDGVEALSRPGCHSKWHLVTRLLGLPLKTHAYLSFVPSGGVAKNPARFRSRPCAFWAHFEAMDQSDFNLSFSAR